MEKQLCSGPSVEKVPNPKNYAKHIPTLKYECEKLFEDFGEELVDALTLKEDVSRRFCINQDVCYDETAATKRRAKASGKSVEDQEVDDLDDPDDGKEL